VEELNVLGRFERGVARETVLEGDTAQLVSEAAVYRKSLKENLKRLGTARGYAEYFESWNPVDLTEQDVVIESLKHMFVKQTLDARIEQALPVLARIQQQGNAMKEANIFEAWANRLVEGTWSTPDTPEAQKKLLDFMSKEQPVGADAWDATEQLYDLLGDDKLFDKLAELADKHPDSDCRQIVLDRMQELSDNPDVRAVLEQLNIDADAAMTPPESLPADLGDQEQGVTEGAGEQWMIYQDFGRGELVPYPHLPNRPFNTKQQAIRWISTVDPDWRNSNIRIDTIEPGRLGQQGVAEGVMSEIDLELREIVANQDFDALYDLLSANTPTGRCEGVREHRVCSEATVMA
jgi:hypothetical protein